MMNRRIFIATAAASAIVPVLPTVVAPEASVGCDMAAGPDLMAYVVGTPGEWNWQHVVARNADDALKAWYDYMGYSEEDVGYLECERVPAFDRLSNPSPGDWLRAGLGHHCSRCGYECSADEGAIALGEQVICEECRTIADIAATDPAQAAEDLADRIADEGAETVEAWLRAEGQWQAVEGDIWAKARDLARDA